MEGAVQFLFAVFTIEVGHQVQASDGWLDGWMHESVEAVFTIEKLGKVQVMQDGGR
jgi:hypothetical protein